MQAESGRNRKLVAVNKAPFSGAFFALHEVPIYLLRVEDYGQNRQGSGESYMARGTRDSRILEASDESWTSTLESGVLLRAAVEVCKSRKARS